jgi:hypothetical protein
MTNRWKKDRKLYGGHQIKQRCKEKLKQKPSSFVFYNLKELYNA